MKVQVFSSPQTSFQVHPHPPPPLRNHFLPPTHQPIKTQNSIFSCLDERTAAKSSSFQRKTILSLLSLCLLTRPRHLKVAAMQICCCRQTNSALTFSVNSTLCAPGSGRAGKRTPRSASRHKGPIHASSSFPPHVPFGASGSASLPIKNRHNSCGSKTLYHKRNISKILKRGNYELQSLTIEWCGA